MASTGAEERWLSQQQGEAPSMTMVCPQIMRAAGEHKKATKPATSSGVTFSWRCQEIARSTMPSSLRTVLKCFKPSVSTIPGDTALTEIFLGQTPPPGSASALPGSLARTHRT